MKKTLSSLLKPQPHDLLEIREWDHSEQETIGIKDIYTYFNQLKQQHQHKTSSTVFKPKKKFSIQKSQYPINQNRVRIKINSRFLNDSMEKEKKVSQKNSFLSCSMKYLQRKSSKDFRLRPQNHQYTKLSKLKFSYDQGYDAPFSKYYKNKEQIRCTIRKKSSSIKRIPSNVQIKLKGSGEEKHILKK